MATLDETFSLLRDLNEPVPKSGKLPTAEQVDDVEQATGSAFPKDLIRYFLEVSDVVVGTLEPVTLDDRCSPGTCPNLREQWRLFLHDRKRSNRILEP